VLPVRTVAIAAVLVASTGAGSYTMASAHSPQSPRPQAVVRAASAPAAGRVAATTTQASTPAKKRPATSSAVASTAGATGTSTSRPVRCTTTVSAAARLVTAVARLHAGRTVCLAPGRYRLSARLVLGAAQSGTAKAPAVLAARRPGTVTIDGNGNEEALYIAGARHVVVTGLRITGGAYHGVKIDYPSSDVVLRRLVIVDNVRAGDAGGQYSGVKGCCLVRRVTIEDSDVYYSRPAPASTNHQGIDCNGCKGWVVRGNRVHGIRAAQAEAGGTGIQFKSGSADTVIDSNIVYGNFVGITYGGFGNPALYGHETYEHVRGIVRNNVVYGNQDAGISVINTRDGRVYNNTLFGNGFTPDVRVTSRNLRYENNVLDRPLNLRDGTTAFTRHNYVLRSPTSGGLFVNAAARNFIPRSTARVLIDRGADLGKAVPTDARGRHRRAGHYDIGAFER
jgi:parallel beta-helix repeat protein